MLGKLSRFYFYLYDFSLTAKSISRENFCNSLKIRETFVVYGIIVHVESKSNHNHNTYEISIYSYEGNVP